MATETVAPRLLIGTRFGLSIHDPAWYEHRLVVFSAITAASMLAQDDQDFEWALFVDPELPAAARSGLDDILAPFAGRAFLHTQDGLIRDSLPRLAEERGLVDPDGYMLTGRIDDDDGWHRTTVGDVRRRVARWLDRKEDSRGFCMTYDDGLVWLMYDMADVDRLRRRGAKVTHRAAVRPFASQFTSMSGFVCSQAADGMTSYCTKHSALPAVLGDKGFTIEVVSTAEPMWLYTRHKQATGSPDKTASPADEDMSVAALAKTFGIDAPRTHRYLADADTYGYRRFNPLKRRGAYRTLLLKLEDEIGTARANGRPTAQLEHQKQRLLDKQAQDLEAIVERA
jgi:hypothetical protein